MSTEIKTTEARHSDALLGALEQTLKHHDLRLKPGQTLADVADGFAAEQVTLSEAHGYLTAEMSGNPVHLSKVIEAFAEKQGDRFFPRTPDGVKSRDQLDLKAKSEYIAKFGYEKFAALPQTAPQGEIVELDRNRLTRKQWLSLDLKTRATLSATWGAGAIGSIMARK